MDPTRKVHRHPPRRPARSEIKKIDPAIGRGTSTPTLNTTAGEMGGGSDMTAEVPTDGQVAQLEPAAATLAGRRDP